MNYWLFYSLEIFWTLLVLQAIVMAGLSYGLNINKFIRIGSLGVAAVSFFSFIITCIVHYRTPEMPEEYGLPNV